MTAPNIVNVTSIIGRTITANLTTTAATRIVSNTSGSGKVFKINAMYITNIDTAVNIPVTINHYSTESISGTATGLVSTIVIPINATLVITSKDLSMYLEENTSLGAIAGTANKIKIVCSYEEIL